MTQPNCLTLNTGAIMPLVGLGTWKSQPGEVGGAVESALVICGYRQVDCAHIYGNEKEIGQVFKKVFSSGQLKREEIFVTSKLWNTFHAQADVATACKQTLQELQLDYLDLYLMHWGVSAPANISIGETWEAMEELVKTGLVKAIGLANFTGAMLIDLLAYSHIKPAVNQIELHPYNQQTRLVDFCQQQGMVVTAYSPLGSPGNMRTSGHEPVLLEDKIIIGIAQNHGKSPAQVLLRWAIQRNTIVIPKSIRPDRLKSNINLFDFELSPAEMELIASLDKKHRYIDPYDWWHIPYFD